MPKKTQSAVLAPIIPLLRHLTNWDNICRKLFICKDLCVYYVKSAWGVCKVSQSKAFGVFLVLGALGYYLPQDVLAYPEIDLSAIAQIESSGRADAKGDGGKALGMYQLHQAVITDYNKAHKSQYSHRDALNPQISHRIALWYTSEELPRLLRHFKQPVTEKNIITAYNAGISSVIRNRVPLATRKYWQKYEQLLNKQKNVSRWKNLKN